MTPNNIRLAIGACLLTMLLAACQRTEPPPEPAASRFGDRGHCMLSLACPISPMKTSSSDGSIIFQTSAGSLRWRSTA